MLMKKSFLWAGCLISAVLSTACSSDKVLPEGKRMSVLSPVASIKADVVNPSGKIAISPAVESNSWEQGDFNAQHLIPNLKIGTTFEKQWQESFGEGKSKREFLVARPLVKNGVVYTLDVDGVVSAFTLADGEEIWTTELKPENKNINDTALKGVGLAMDGDVIYAVTGYGDVYAIGAEKGNVVWTKSLNLPLRIAPTIANGKLFVQSVDNKFFALNLNNGEELWMYDISMENTTLVGGASAVYEPTTDVVMTGFSNGELQALNASIGTPLWSDVLVSNRQAYSSTFLNTIKAAPVVENGVVYAVGNGNILVAIDVRSGTRLWQKEIGSVNTPLVVANVIYLVANTNELVAVAKDSGDVLWAQSLDLGKKPSEVIVMAPVMMNGRIAVTLSNGVVHIFMPQTGKLLSSIDLDEDLNSAPIVAGGYVLFVTADADLIVYK